MKHILAPRSTLVIVVLGRMATAVGSASAHVPGRCEVPASQRTAENGCYVSATVSLSDLPTDPLFRHLRTYPRPAARPRPLRGHGPLSSRRSERCGSTQSPRSSGGLRGGEHVITLGPLELRQGRRYTAHYVEAVFPPGMKTTVHRHPGPEASYVIEGAECVETPNGKVVLRAGQGAVVGDGVPMRFTTEAQGYVGQSHSFFTRRRSIGLHQQRTGRRRDYAASRRETLELLTNKVGETRRYRGEVVSRNVWNIRTAFLR